MVCLALAAALMLRAHLDRPRAWKYVSAFGLTAAAVFTRDTAVVFPRLAGGKRADVVLTDAQGQIELVIQLEGGSKLANRIEPRTGVPIVVMRAASLADEPQRWRTIREHGLPAWRCRCAGTRSLPVDDDFSLRVIGCPIHLRTDDGTQFYARVIEDCGRCAFFVGIGYLGNDRRRIQLRCGYGAPPAERRPAVQAPIFGPSARRQIVAGS